MSNPEAPPADPDRAEREVRSLLATDEGRVVHSRAVADRARALGVGLPRPQRAVLVAAAWLHDVGYAPALHRTGFHPLDGGRWVARTGWPAPVADLVAHHSGARFVAEARGLAAELEVFTFTESPLTDALTVADQTVGPDGRSVGLDDRMADMLRRHGPDSPNARAHARREPYLRAAAARVARRLADLGVVDAVLHRGSPPPGR